MEPLLRRLQATLRSVDHEILFVDDSDDRTPRLIAAAAEANGLTVLHYDADFDRISAVTGAPCAGWAISFVRPSGSLPRRRSRLRARKRPS